MSIDPGGRAGGCDRGQCAPRPTSLTWFGSAEVHPHAKCGRTLEIGSWSMILCRRVPMPKQANGTVTSLLSSYNAQSSRIRDTNALQQLSRPALPVLHFLRKQSSRHATTSSSSSSFPSSTLTASADGSGSSGGGGAVAGAGFCGTGLISARETIWSGDAGLWAGFS